MAPTFGDLIDVDSGLLSVCRLPGVAHCSVASIVSTHQCDFHFHEASLTWQDPI